MDAMPRLVVGFVVILSFVVADDREKARPSDAAKATVGDHRVERTAAYKQLSREAKAVSQLFAGLYDGSPQRRVENTGGRLSPDTLATLTVEGDEEAQAAVAHALQLVQERAAHGRRVYDPANLTDPPPGETPRRRVVYGPFNPTQARRLVRFLDSSRSMPTHANARGGRLIVTADDQAHGHIEAISKACGTVREANQPANPPSH